MSTNNPQTAPVRESRRKSRIFNWGDVVVVVDWLKRVMAERQLSQAALGRILGIERQQVYRVLKGARRLTSDELLKIAKELNVELPASHQPKAPEIRYIKVVGEVAAGVWHDVTYQDFAEFEIPYAYEPKWPPEAVKALIVRGESVNRKAQDGDKIAILMYEYAPRTFREGDYVVAERRRGDLIECTVKLVKGSERTGWELWPDSTDPRYQEPLRLGEHDGEVVRVTAFVLDFIRAGTRF